MCPHKYSDCGSRHYSKVVLALDRDRWTVTELSWLDAYIQYELAGADLKRQTLYDFQTDRSLAREMESDRG